MDRIFFEQIDDSYQIAAVDRQRIFHANNPGELATIFTTSLTHPSAEDDAQIFYALAPSIDADDLFCDLYVGHRTFKLNYWSINSNLEPLTFDQRVELYQTQYSITPNDLDNPISNSLFSLVAASNQQTWKTGILQRCIDRLVKYEYRSNPIVYGCIDYNYRRIMRFKLETSSVNFDNCVYHDDRTLLLFIRRIIKILGLKHSHDPTVFKIIPDSIVGYLTIINNLLNKYKIEGSVENQLSTILTLWSGSSLNIVDGGFQIKVDPLIEKGLEYLNPLLIRPKNLIILEASM
ncbi:MAG: hypothetical protein MUO21_08570 [Nitrososphaeraceae archaeon]|nr:hypothetical protein [Nitrososphaeraceae archaeon]